MAKINESSLSKTRTRATGLIRFHIPTITMRENKAQELDCHPQSLLKLSSLTLV